MNVLPKQKMTVEQFLAWIEEQPKYPRYELIDGVPLAMAAEQIGHARVKKRVVNAFDRGIEAAGLDCEALPDGMAVRIDDYYTYEPDAQVYCGKRMEDGDILVPGPIIVVEVLSPSTKHVDAADKLSGYFQLESLRHYLMVDPRKRLVTHHARDDQGVITMRIVRDGAIELAPPGLTVHLEELFEDR